MIFGETIREGEHVMFSFSTSEKESRATSSSQAPLAFFENSVPNVAYIPIHLNVSAKSDSTVSLKFS